MVDVKSTLERGPSPEVSLEGGPKLGSLQHPKFLLFSLE